MQGALAQGVEHQQDGHIAQGVVQPLPHHAKEQEVIEPPLYGLLCGEHSIGVVLLAGKNDGFHIQMGVSVGVKIAYDQVWSDTQSIQMVKAAVAENVKIVWI